MNRQELLAEVVRLHEDAQNHWSRGSHAAGNLLFGKALGFLFALHETRPA